MIKKVALFGALIAMLLARPAYSTADIYPWPGDKKMAAADVRVTVDGRNVFTYNLLRRGKVWGGIPTIASEFAKFELRQGEAEIAIEFFGGPVNQVRVRRLGRDVHVRSDRNQIHFRIEQAGAYSVEINRDLANRAPLLIFADRPESWSPREGDISFAAGSVSNIGVLRLRRHGQRVHIPGGAVVRGIIKVEAPDISVSGAGIILFDDVAAKDSRIAAEDDNSPLLATDANGLALAGLTVVVAPTSLSSGPGGAPVAPWAVHILRSSGVTISDVNIINLLRDGLDIDGSDHVVVHGGLIQALDDSICAKATNFGPGEGARQRGVRDILFKDILVSNTGAGAALAVGTELHTQSVSGITFQNIDILHALGRHGTAISVRNGDRAKVGNILFDHINILDRPGTLLRLSVETDGYKPDPERGSIDDVRFQDLEIDRRDIAQSLIQGVGQHTVSNIVFKNAPFGMRLNLAVKGAPAPRWLSD